MKSKRDLIAQAGNILYEKLSSCGMCPRGCGVNRLEGQEGFCRTGSQPEISGYEPHFGEEACLVGEKGSGAIFFTGCNLACVFCQTFEISQLHQGTVISNQALAEIMLKLKKNGCHNLNLVTPSHQVAAILKALETAMDQGFDLPVVYNTGGYDSIETLRLLEGMVDIYVPDFKVWDEEVAARIIGARDYPEVARKAIKEMHRQVGDLVLDQNGLTRRGLLVRHLVLPGDLSDTEKVLEFIVNDISRNTYLDLMGHYHPYGLAQDYPPLDRTLYKSEFRRALEICERLGLRRLDRTHYRLLDLILGDAPED